MCASETVKHDKTEGQRQTKAVSALHVSVTSWILEDFTFRLKNLFLHILTLITVLCLKVRTKSKKKKSSEKENTPFVNF